jgi:hypothetical protein
MTTLKGFQNSIRLTCLNTTTGMLVSSYDALNPRRIGRISMMKNNLVGRMTK